MVSTYGSTLRPLGDGLLDIIGDIHGEIESLRGLMTQLGYDELGLHPSGRRLVLLEILAIAGLTARR